MIIELCLLCIYPHVFITFLIFMKSEFTSRRIKSILNQLALNSGENIKPHHSKWNKFKRTLRNLLMQATVIWPMLHCRFPTTKLIDLLIRPQRYNKIYFDSFFSPSGTRRIERYLKKMWPLSAAVFNFGAPFSRCHPLRVAINSNIR